MTHRSRKPSRWPAALAEALLLCLPTLAAQAAATSDAPVAVANASATDANSLLMADAAAEMPASAGGIDLYLETTLNGTDRGLAHFSLRGGELWTTLATLRQLGFRPAAGTPDPVRLNSLQGVSVNYNQEQQTASIVAPLALLHLATSTIDTRDVHAPKATSAPGLLLNYNLYGTKGTGGSGSLSAFTELRAFNSHGVFSNTMLNQSTRSNGTWNSRSVRLDTSWNSSFPDRMLTLRLGDTLTAATSWSRPTRIGGIQIGTNFALQPYNITTPLPQFFGSATLPSQVQLYINGMQQYNGSVPSGPFQLNAVPGITGAGNAQVVLTNALGQVTTLNFSLYGTQQLLRAGLTDWSAELGFVRRNYGLTSFNYGGDPVASGTWRRGISNSFTAEVHAEATNRLLDAGVGGNWLLGQTGGVLSAAAAHSTGGGLAGSQLSLGYQWSNRTFNFGLNGVRAGNDYRDAASSYGGGPPPHVSVSAQAGMNTGALGNFGVGYAQLSYQQQTSRYASVYWSKAINRKASLNLSANQNLGAPRDRSVFLTLTFSLDDRTYASAGIQHSAGQNTLTADVVRSVPTEGGWGWRAQTQQGSDTHGGQAEVDYLGRYGAVQAGVSKFAGSSYAWAGANGSLVLMGGGLFPARQIYNGFAVVSTDGIPNVPVKLENNLVGATNSKGLLLVTPLNSYQNNKISIDPMNLPADVRVGQVDQDATPTDRAGTLVKFGITPIRAATIVLHDSAGKPLALGSQVRVQGQTGESALVGFDGAVYLDTLQKHNVLDVSTPSGACKAAFDYHAQGDTIPQIGPVDCTQEVSQ